jgi:hypothetical protein
MGHPRKSLKLPPVIAKHTNPCGVSNDICIAFIYEKLGVDAMNIALKSR